MEQVEDSPVLVVRRPLIQDWQVNVSLIAIEDEVISSPPDAPLAIEATPPSPGLLAARLGETLQTSGGSFCYVAESEAAAEEIAAAFCALFPQLQLLVLPPWDCLPYDRLPPSPHSMGRRMDALRIWMSRSADPTLLITSLEAVLQRVPPTAIIEASRLELVVGKPFDPEAFDNFVRQTGYVAEGVADDPGEVVVREGVIDIYPAGAPGPMRIVLCKDNHVLELRGFDRSSQRTESFLERVTLGPATEAVLPNDSWNEEVTPSGTMERLLSHLFEDMPSALDLLGDAEIHLAPGIKTLVSRHFDIIEDARQLRFDVDHAESAGSHAFYLTPNEWDRYADRMKVSGFKIEEGTELPIKFSRPDAHRSIIGFVQNASKQGQKIVIAGMGKGFETLCRRVAKAMETPIRAVESWDDILASNPRSLLKFPSPLETGFIDLQYNIAVIASPQSYDADQRQGLLREPELRIGDVVVHEDHGIGILRNLEPIDIEGHSRDTARLEYRDGGSVLVPMEEFGKLWRYGSEAEAVSLDRLHTQAWQKKREKIARDIQATARHLAAFAQRRQSANADKFVPPAISFASFARRFPYPETPDQILAINDVLGDLASGRPMNRLVCGDVGFGKTEVALRAAAAVALAGGQVVLIAPTTVLARQHFNTFKQRFAGTSIKIGLLSRLVNPREAKQVKAALAEGELDITIATHAVLAKDVSFARLALLIVDEEHRFGEKEKQAMKALAPSLHVLAMSATPIPRTLQSAMVGIQEVSLLTTPPRKRLPIRTVLTDLDSASIRTNLMREFRRGGQSFVVVPRIEDIEGVEQFLRKAVPELSIKIAHGKMPVADIDEAIIGFSAGDGDVLLATNIIENGLDMPRANTIFIWNAELFGLSQLHQLRGRVGRGSIQGSAILITKEADELSPETYARLLTVVENNRLGSGLAISMRDLDLRGGGDLAGERQAGHIKAIGVGLYQSLLSWSVARSRQQQDDTGQRAVLHMSLASTIPQSYVSDAALRLNLYAKLFRVGSPKELDELSDEFEDRFGDIPPDVELLLRLVRLQLFAAKLGIAKIEAGPKGLALTVASKGASKKLAASAKKSGASWRAPRFVFEMDKPIAGEEQLGFVEQFLEHASAPTTQP